jgi:hypothetical protein
MVLEKAGDPMGNFLALRVQLSAIMEKITKVNHIVDIVFTAISYDCLEKSIGYIVIQIRGFIEAEVAVSY